SVIFSSLPRPSSKCKSHCSCASKADSIAIRTMFTVVKDRFPLPTDVFSPCLLENTLVLHPIVAHSYMYLFGSSALHFSCLLKLASKLIKFGKNLFAVTLHANLYRS